MTGLATILPLTPWPGNWALRLPENDAELEVHLFSKHLQFLGYGDMAMAASDLGFDGVELTVRESGHVEPEQVETDLPRAVEAIRKQGLKATMMVSDITELNPLSRTVLETAASLGIRSYRLGYYDYPDQIAMPEALRRIREKMKALATFGKELGIQATFQNHAGGLVGAVMWEIWQLVDGIDPDAVGVQYDIRHAMVDGGQSWENGLRLIRERIRTLAIKDYRWGKEEGEWEVINVPIGEGMVDFLYFFELLKAYGIQVPVSLHLEYELSGAEHGEKDPEKVDAERVYQAMRRDLEAVRNFWKEA